MGFGVSGILFEVQGFLKGLGLKRLRFEGFALGVEGLGTPRALINETLKTLFRVSG